MINIDYEWNNGWPVYGSEGLLCAVIINVGPMVIIDPVKSSTAYNRQTRTKILYDINKEVV